MSEINALVAEFSRCKIGLSCGLAWPVVYSIVRTIMSTPMFLLLLMNVLCFAQNLRCATSVSCDLKSSEFKKSLLQHVPLQEQLLHRFLELVRKCRGGFVSRKLTKVVADPVIIWLLKSIVVKQWLAAKPFCLLRTELSTTENRT